MTKYFSDCTTIEELKKAYRKECMRLHPDLNGKATEEEFKKMNEEYKNTLKRLGNAKNFSSADNEEAPFDWTKDKFAEIIQKIVLFDGMKIEIIGEWIWCFDSFAYRNELKELGFWFSGTQKSRSRGRYTLNQLRDIHGSHVVETSSRKRIG